MLKNPEEVQTAHRRPAQSDVLTVNIKGVSSCRLDSRWVQGKIGVIDWLDCWVSGVFDWPDFRWVSGKEGDLKGG